MPFCISSAADVLASQRMTSHIVMSRTLEASPACMEASWTCSVHEITGWDGHLRFAMVGANRRLGSQQLGSTS
jgi:hypothetical protein